MAKETASSAETENEGKTVPQHSTEDLRTLPNERIRRIYHSDGSIFVAREYDIYSRKIVIQMTGMSADAFTKLVAADSGELRVSSYKQEQSVHGGALIDFLDSHMGYMNEGEPDAD